MQIIILSNLEAAFTYERGLGTPYLRAAQEIPGKSRRDGMFVACLVPGSASLSTIIPPLRAWASLRGNPLRLNANWFKTLFLGKTLVENQLAEPK